ncbi:P-loop NTPase fold protein [Reichenbachiella sp. MSK19-1]|uniref:P-loop NTPase fold protein n=1 Tax=Reichenbachiella sp. MSK19-1 TaxID=1897631 RepID=UPI000E6CBC6E|nr:P-loop NTPase fold protein [Reichenbachiella sp. MSK19-1]RJE75181.1 hypothetical protein BGP76_18945 [Reichenbachiella sp. MSK19-1]
MPDNQPLKKSRSQLLKQLKTNPFTKRNRGTYLATRKVGGKDMAKTFIQHKRWDNGLRNLNDSDIAETELGDIVFMFRNISSGSSGKKNVGISFFGFVTGNIKDGHNLDIDWTTLSKEIVVSNLSMTNKGFQKIDINEIDNILNVVIDQNPDIVDKIIGSDMAIDGKNKNKTTPLLDTNGAQALIEKGFQQNQNFWWASYAQVGIGQVPSDSPEILPFPKDTKIEPKKGELIVAASKQDSCIHSLLRIVDVIGSSVYAYKVYSLDRKTHFSELLNNSTLLKYGFQHKIDSLLTKIEPEEFNAIIISAELGSKREIQFLTLEDTRAELYPIIEESDFFWITSTYKEDLNFDLFDISFQKSNQDLNDISINQYGLICQREHPRSIIGIFKVVDVSFIDFPKAKIQRVYNLKSPLPLESLKDVDLSGNEHTIIKKLSKEVFLTLLKSTEIWPIIDDQISASLSLSGFSCDSPNGDKDLLNIENDVRSLALLLAYKNVNPPIAVGLFGKWGSGKSFFMKQLERRIKSLSKYQTFWDGKGSPISGDHIAKEYCEGIAHIWFNAWSYLDSNLWAGLAHSLFEKLNEYITNQTKGEIEKLKVQVRLSKRLQLLHSDLSNYREKKYYLEGIKTELEEEKNHKIAKYFLSQYTKKTIQFLTNNGLSEDLLATLTPITIKRKIESEISVWSYLKRNVEIVIKSIIVVLVVFLAKYGISEFWLDVSEYLRSAWANITSIVIPTGVITFKDFFYKKQQVIKDLVDAMAKLKSEKPEDEELQEIKKEINEIDPIINEIEESIKREYSFSTDITQVAIANFLSSKINQQDYIDRLGIVSIIRKDFETLSDLFYPINSNSDLSEYQKQLNADRVFIQDQFEKPNRLERIVLYIDDLDRCSDEKVLEVIQAVHLLMAFPLFNVVVGVDDKCIMNAISSRYKALGNGANGTTENYFEKIFQIPFKLKEPSSNDVENLIEDLLEGQIDNLEAEYSDDYLSEVDINSEKPNQNDDKISSNKEKKLNTEIEKSIVQEPKVKDKSTGEIHVPAYNLRMSKTELEYIKAMTFLIGNTPRTIKRFINIYRIIRSHEQLVYKEDNKDKHFLTVIFLLSLITGVHKNVYKNYLKEVKDTPAATVKDYNLKFEELKSHESNISSNQKIRILLDIDGNMLLKHSPFVSRFSFR